MCNGSKYVLLRAGVRSVAMAIDLFSRLLVGMMTILEKGQTRNTEESCRVHEN